LGQNRFNAPGNRRPRAKRFHVGALLIVALAAYTSAVADASSVGAESLTDQIQAAAKAFVAAQHAEDVEIAVGYLDPRLTLTACASALDVFAAPGGRHLGNTSVGVRCAAPEPWTIYVPVAVTAYQDAVSTARALPRGVILGSADISVTRLPVNSLPNGAFSDSGLVIGKVITRPIAAGTVVTAGMVATAKIVRRGQILTLLARGGGIEVRGSGRALADAAAGDRVKVENTSSKRVVEGTVLADGVIQIDL
jgi:flagella basal body P-ring formation protein FlgA